MHEDHILSGPPEGDIEKSISFGQLMLDVLKRRGTDIVQIDGITGIATTAAELVNLSVRLAEVLKAKGITKYDKICISSENRLEFTVIAIAALCLGAAIAPLNVTYNEGELQHALNLSKPKIIFCSSLTALKILCTIRHLPYVQEVVFIGATPPDGEVLTLDALMSNANIPRGDIDTFAATPVDLKTHTAAILCSSGTSGLPKGVEITHWNMMHSYSLVVNRTSINGKGPVALALLPWFHCFGLIGHISMMGKGYNQIVIPKFEGHLFLKCIQDYKITDLRLVPPLMVFLAKHPAVDDYNLSSLRDIRCGAAPLGKELTEAVRKRIPSLEVVLQGYGLTETTLGVLITPVGKTCVDGSVGVLNPGMQGKVIDFKTGQALGPYKLGEFCFRGPLVMKGYVGDKNSTDGAIDEDNWLHTGDIGYYDKNEYWFVVDRLKELIKYKGFQVPPAELEALLLTHAGVKDAAVIGIPDEKAGELPLAFIVRQTNSNVTEKEIQDFVASKMSHAKRLHGGVKIIKEIPKTASGKILRRELREMAKLSKSKL